MNKLYKRLSMLTSATLVLSGAIVPTFARDESEPLLRTMVFSMDQKDVNYKVDGKNIKGITTTDKNSAQKLAESLVSNDVKVTSAKLIGDPRAFGYFSNAYKEVGFEDGIVLSTGQVHNIFERGYDTFNSSSLLKSTTSAGLEFGFTGDSFNDIAILEFEVIPTTDTLSFQYVLASEEYPEYATVENFFDEFILLINGTNYAIVPNTDKEVSIGTINHVVNSQYYRGIYEESTTSGAYTIGTPISTDAFVYNGATKVFSVDVKVNPNVPNTIRLGIGDKGDHIFDSSIFIKANSIKSKPATPGVISIASKKGQTVELLRQEGSDGYVNATWEAYGEAPVATFSTYSKASASNLLGTGVVEFNDGQTTSNFTVPQGTTSISISNFQGGAVGGAITQTPFEDIPAPGEVTAPSITGKYSNKSIQLSIAANGNLEGYEYALQRGDDSYMTAGVVTVKDWSTTLAAIDSEVESGKTYYYRVKTRNAKGFESLWSEVVKIKAVASQEGGSSSDSDSSSSSDSSSNNSQKYSKVLLKEKVAKMTQDEKAKYVATLLENMPYTYEKTELKEFLKTTITKSQLDDKDKGVFLTNLDLFVELNCEKYAEIDLKKVDKGDEFKDLTRTHWAFDVVEELVKQGVVKGYEDQTFRPKDVLTVKDTFTFLDRVVKNHKVTKFKNPRSIVEKYITDETSWAHYNVASIGSKISKETLAQFQDTNTIITRQQLAQVIFELTNGQLEKTAIMGTFKDWSLCTNKEAVQYCVEIGVMTGYPDQTIAPDKSLTRAELMSVLLRIDSLLK